MYHNSLLTPVIAPTAALATPSARTTKRGTTAINYAEDGYDDYDDDDEEGGRRRPTGLRSLRRDDSALNKVDQSEKYGKEIHEPVAVQGVWREWMGKSRSGKADLQAHAQAALPLNLIPIRIDLEIPGFIPQAPLPLPTGGGFQVDREQSVYKTPEMTVPFRLKDTFLWNLHENQTTTDQFAQCLVQDLDLPHRQGYAMEISKQIRTQLEEYAGVAMHPLFHAASAPAANGVTKVLQIASRDDGSSTPMTGVASGRGTPLQASINTPGNNTPIPNSLVQTNGNSTPLPDVTASAESIKPAADDYDPDDSYRCIVELSVNLGPALYNDKFEWSLLHPPGHAEHFAKVTCADLGLTGEWIPAMTHAIYEAVLRLKKEACESGGLVGLNLGTEGGYQNDCVNEGEAGWRYNTEDMCYTWEPKFEILSKEEIEKREIDRDRQIRRMRRETARFSSNTGMAGGVPQGTPGGYFDEPNVETMGRGERSKKKRRFRSLSPVGRGTPGRGTPDVGSAGFGGGAAALTEYERSSWRCAHCRIWGTAIWAVRDGPKGPRSLCNNCGLLYERDRHLPAWMKDSHKNDLRITDTR